MTNALRSIRPPTGLLPLPGTVDARWPAIIERAGPGGRFAADEFSASVTNPHTRRAYGRVVGRFLVWCEARELELRQVTPGYAAGFIDDFDGAAAAKKQALAALRHFFDLLVTRHAVALNPFLSVRGPRSSALEGKTPAITVEQTRRLLASIDCSTRIGLRDRAVIGTLTYTGARVGAVEGLQVKDLRDYGDHRALRFHEKGGVEREIPVRIDLDRWLTEYMESCGLDAGDAAGPLFRAAQHKGHGGKRGLTTRPLAAYAIRGLVKRRLKDVGLPTILSPHSFRVLVVTDLLEQGVPLEDVQYLAGHARPTTTQIYDRRGREVSRNLVERISV